MRIVIHFDKRTAHAPCLFDIELNVAPKDDALRAEFGRATAESIRRRLEGLDGFEPARRRLRGCPSAIMRYHASTGEFDAPDSSGMAWAPHIRVAFANLLTALAEAEPREEEERTEAACRGCRHFEERPGLVRSYWFRGRPIINGRTCPYCAHPARDEFLTYAEYSAGCGRREAKEASR